MNYLIQNGDNLYQIAQRYNLNVNDIIKHNPHLNPYTLHIGSYIYIPITSNNLEKNMRRIWEQHVFWTRLLIVSVIEHLKDEPDTTQRLLRNAKDLAELFRPYYGDNIANKIENLITDHLVIANNLVHAIITNNTVEVNKLNTEWYKNADDIAASLSSINPYYNKEELRKMLYTHLDLTKEEVTNRLNHNYKKEIEIFDEIEKEALIMADYFTEGIKKQYK